MSFINSEGKRLCYTYNTIKDHDTPSYLHLLYHVNTLIRNNR